MELTCPVCGALNAFASDQEGRMGKCGKCATPLYIPRPEELPTAPLAVRATPRHSPWLKRAVAAGLVIMVLLAVAAAYSWWPRADSDERNASGPQEPAVTDIGGDFASALAITLNASGTLTQDSRFEFAGDHDVFKFKATVTGTMLIQFDSGGDKEGASRLDGRLYAYNSAQKEIGQNDSDADKRVPQILLAVTAEQEYYVKAAAADDKATGQYKLGFTTIGDVGNTAAAALEVKLSRTGYAAQAWTIDPVGDEDYFCVAPPLAGAMVVELVPGPGSNLDSTLAVFDSPSPRDPIVEESGKNAIEARRTRFPVQPQKTYWVKVAAFRDAEPLRKTGAYTLTFRIEKPPADDYGNDSAKAHQVKLASDGSAFLAGRIDPLGDKDFFSFTPAAAGEIVVKMLPDFDSQLACALVAYDAAGAKIAADDFGDDAFMKLSVSAGKTYFIQAAAGNKAPLRRQTGAYSLSFRTERPLRDPGDKRDPAAGFDDAREIPLTAAGAGNQSGNLSFAGALDFYRFKAAVSGDMVVEMRPGFNSPLDCCLTVYDDRRQFLATQDVGFASALRFPVKAGKTYYLKAASTTRPFAPAGAKTGTYVITLRSEREAQESDFKAAQPIELSADGFGRKSGRINVIGAADYYKFQAPASGLATVEMGWASGDYLSTRLVVYDGSRNMIKEENSGGLSFVQLETAAGATYYLKAAAGTREFDVKTGGYTLTIRTGKSLADDYGDLTSPHPINVQTNGSATVKGRLEILGDLDAFRFQAPATGLVTLALAPSAPHVLDTRLWLYDQNNNLIDQDDQGRFSSVEFHAQTGKTYYIKAGAGSKPFLTSGARVGEYILTVQTGKALADDVGNNFDLAKEIKLSPQGSALQPGRIEVFGDVDFFRFTAPVSGVMTVDMRPEGLSSQLWTHLLVYDSAKQQVSKLNPQFDLFWRCNVQAGQTYYVKAAASANPPGPSNRVGAYRLDLKTTPAFPPASAKAAAKGNLWQTLPHDTLAFGVVNRLDQTSAKLDTIAKKLRLPITGSPLALAKTMLGIGTGLDEQGSAAVAVVPGAYAWDAPVPLLLVAVTNYSDFIRGLGALDASAQITQVNVLKENFLVGRKGSFAVLVRPAFRSTLERVLSSSQSFSGVSPSLQTWVSEHDLACVVSSQGVKAILPLVQPGLAAAKLTAKQPLEAEFIDAVSGFFKAAQSEVTEFGVAAKLDSQNNAILSARLRFAPGGRFAGAVDAVPALDLFRGLPDQPFALAAAGAFPKDTFKGIQALHLGALKREARLGEKQIHDIANAFARVTRGVHGGAFMFGPTKHDEPILDNFYAVLHAPDANALLADYEAAQRTAAAFYQQAGFQAVQWRRITVAGLPVVEIRAPRPAEVTPADKRNFKALFGAGNDIFTSYAARDKQTILMRVGPAELLSQTLPRQAVQGSLGTNAQVVKTARLLPEQPQWVVYLSPKEMVELVDLLQRLGGPGAVALAGFREGPPIGLAVKLSAQEGELRLVVPAAVLDNAGQFVEQMRQQWKPLP